MSTPLQRYNFEYSTIFAFIDLHKSTTVALQFPEGLLAYSFLVASEIESHRSVECCILADDCYGACCIDDRLVQSLGIDCCIHFGHSELVPSKSLSVPFMYCKAIMPLEVDPQLPSQIFNEVSSWVKDKTQSLVLTCTTQFVPLTNATSNLLISAGFSVNVPKCSPNLSKGECLGCTVNRFSGDSNTVIVYIGDGRFHLEALAMHNPDLTILKFDPISRKLTQEYQDVDLLLQQRHQMLVNLSRKETLKIGLVLSSLGRQGSETVCKRLEQLAKRHDNISVVVLNVRDISTEFIESFRSFVDLYVVVGCPRLPLDWGTEFQVPLLTTHEAFKLFTKDFTERNFIPMDNFSIEGGPWANIHINKR
ncbi:hypothetical protein GEMRC1_008579 [Eukaryota sp. GEM-RC1]